MLNYIARRLAQSVIVMLAVLMISFMMFRFAGDPVNQMVGVETSLEQRAKLRDRLGLNDPVLVQFGRYVKNAAVLDFGVSYQHKRPVTELFAQKLPATIELALVSVVFSLVLGIPAGLIAGLRRRSLVSRTLMTMSLVGVSLPTFVIGILLIYFVGIKLGWRPVQGREGVTDLGYWTTSFLTVEGWKSLLLPSVTLGLYQLTLVMRLVRAETLEIVRTDHIKFARARGLPDRIVYGRHVLKNTLPPVITIAGLQLGTIVAFAIVTESVFTWPGVGRMFLHAVGNVDIPVMAAYLAMVAFLFVTINLCVDMLYYLIDPRLRSEAGRPAT